MQPDFFDDFLFNSIYRKGAASTFTQKNIELWNKSPDELRHAKSLFSAKKIATDFVKTLPI